MQRHGQSYRHHHAQQASEAQKRADQCIDDDQPSSITPPEYRLIAVNRLIHRISIVGDAISEISPGNMRVVGRENTARDGKCKRHITGKIRLYLAVLMGRASS